MQMAIPVLLILGQIIQAVGGIAFKELTRLGGKKQSRSSGFPLTCLRLGVSQWQFSFTPGKGIDFSQTAADTVQAQEISPSETLINFIPTQYFRCLVKRIDYSDHRFLPCFWDCFKIVFCKRIRSRNY